MKYHHWWFVCDFFVVYNVFFFLSFFATYIYLPCLVRFLVAQKNVDSNYSYLVLPYL